MHACIHAYIYLYISTHTHTQGTAPPRHELSRRKLKGAMKKKKKANAAWLRVNAMLDD